MNNRRLLERLDKIKQKETTYVKPKEHILYKNNKKIYDIIQRRIVMEKIAIENARLNQRINKL